jgi:3-oxoacyl-[acyl-carrier-protein] synthase-1
MRPVFISHAGLWCAAGSGPSRVRAFLGEGRRPGGRIQVLSQTLPYAFATDPALPWKARMDEALGRVGAALDLPALPPEAPFLLGSSCLSIGAVEEAGWPPSARSMEPLDDQVRACWGIGNRGWLFSSGCTSGVQALDAGVALIESGGADEVLVLGVEILNRTTLAGFSSLQLLSSRDSRPLDAHRSGMVLGEAVAALRLSARPGPWRIHAPAVALDATSATGHAVDGSSIAQVMAEALDHAGFAPEQLRAIKLQASGAPGTDAVEARALRRVFGAALPPLFSIKASLGHTLGACGIAETAAVLACGEEGWLPPTAGFETQDPELDLAPSVLPVPWTRGPVLFTIQGFGGSLGAWVVEKA